MKPMVRPARPGSWNCRNCLMNRQGTVWNHSEPETFKSGSTWNRNRVEPESDENETEPTQPGPCPSLDKVMNFRGGFIKLIFFYSFILHVPFYFFVTKLFS